MKGQTCPLLLVEPHSSNGTTILSCWGNNCVWYDGEQKQCAVISILNILKSIKNKGELKNGD